MEMEMYYFHSFLMDMFFSESFCIICWKRGREGGMGDGGGPGRMW